MKKYTLQSKMKRAFTLVLTGIILVTTILMSVVIGKAYWNKSYQLCEQLVSLNLNLLNNQIMQIQRMQEFIASNNSVNNAVEFYNNRGQRDYVKELKYQRELDKIFYMMATGSLVSNAYIIDKHGTYVYFYKDSLKSNYNMHEEDWYQALIDNIILNVSYVSGLHNRSYLVNDSGKECISMIRPIQSGQGYTFSVDAYLVCDIDLDSILNSGDSKEDMQFALLDTNNELYSSEPFAFHDREKQRVINAVSQNEKQVQLIQSNITTSSIVVSMKSKLFGLKLIGVKELKEIKDMNMILIIILFSTILLAILSIIVLSNRIAKSILMPMNRLILNCNRVSEGDYQVIFEEEESEEVSYLSHTIGTMVNNIVRLSEQVVEEEKELSDEKLRVLQHQINPHFLNNVLQTIKALSVEKETEKISRISTLLGRILTYSVYQPHQNVALKVELEYLQNYIELQNIRYEDRVLYSIDCDEKVENVLIPKLTLQPLIENAIEHGFEGEGKLMINISAEEETDMVCVMINDDGQGISQEKFMDLQERLRTGEVYKQERSIGIVNVNERLRKMYGEEYGVQIMQKNQRGTLVVVRIPKSMEETGL
jgi:two-component system sensor histidine kinase YesM